MLTVTNDESLCKATKTIEVGEDRTDPVASIAPVMRGDCDESPVTLTLGGAVAAAPEEYTITWTAPSGSTAAGLTTASDEAGRHVATVERDATGCEAVFETDVSFREPPAVSLTVDERTLRCGDGPLALVVSDDALASGQAISWTIDDAPAGPNAPTPDPDDPARYLVDVGGAYRLVLTATDPENGACKTSSEAVTITDARVVVTADAGETLRLACGEDATVTAEPSMTDASLVYAWTTDEDAPIVDADAHAATFSAPGLYRLTVTDPVGGCDDVAVLEVLAPDLSTLRADITETGFELGCDEERTITVDAAAGAGIREIRWTSGSTEGETVAMGPGITIVNPGRYFATVVENGTACTLADSLEVTQVTPFTVAEIPTDRLDCEETSVTVTTDVDNPSDLSLTYAWTALGEGSIVSGAAAAAAEVTAGRYQVTVADEGSGCKAVKFATVRDAGIPIVSAGSPQDITCASSVALLSGSGPGEGYSYAWTTADGELSTGTETSLSAVAKTPGTYALEIVNDETGCRAADEVTIGEDLEPPVATLPSQTVGNCERQPFSIRAGGAASADTTAYDYRWIGPGGTAAGTSATVTVTTAGLYTLEITRLRNGCPATVETEVSWRERPEATFTADEETLICGRETVTLSITSTAVGDGTVASWTIDGETAGAAAPTPVDGSSNEFRASSAGAYRLVLTSEDGECVTTSDPLDVRDLRDRLAVDAGRDLQLTCRDTEMATETVALEDERWTIAWTGPGGEAPEAPTSLRPTLRQAGVYEITVTDPETKCTGSDQVEVFAPITAGLSAALPEAFTLGCGERREVALTFGTPGDAPASLRWWEADAEDVTIAAADRLEIAAGGRYFAEVTDEETGCTAVDSVEVTQVLPFTTLDVAPRTLDCAQTDTTATLQLDNPDGLRIGYTWSVLGDDGGAIVSGGATPTARLTPGTYRVTARDLDGDCDAGETVVVGAYEGEVAMANATATYDDCVGELTLDGTAAADMTPRWTLLQGELPDLITDDATMTLLDPAPGSYRLTYQLVPAYCLPSAPVEVAFEIGRAPAIEIYDAAATAAKPTRDTTIQLIPSLLQEKFVATLDTTFGEASVEINDANQADISDWISEELTIQFEVCERECVTRCKTVRYVLLRGDRDDVPTRVGIGLPNTITPNDDGLNERFVVDEILDNPDRYPNARLTVINRLGEASSTRSSPTPTNSAAAIWMASRFPRGPTTTCSN